MKSFMLTWYIQLVLTKLLIVSHLCYLFGPNWKFSNVEVIYLRQPTFASLHHNRCCQIIAGMPSSFSYTDG